MIVSDMNGSPRLKKLIRRISLLRMFFATVSMSAKVSLCFFRLLMIVFLLQYEQFRLHSTVFSTMMPRLGVV